MERKRFSIKYNSVKDNRQFKLHDQVSRVIDYIAKKNNVKYWDLLDVGFDGDGIVKGKKTLIFEYII